MRRPILMSIYLLYAITRIFSFSSTTCALVVILPILTSSRVSRESRCTTLGDAWPNWKSYEPPPRNPANQLAVVIERTDERLQSRHDGSVAVTLLSTDVLSVRRRKAWRSSRSVGRGQQQDLIDYRTRVLDLEAPIRSWRHCTHPPTMMRFFTRSIGCLHPGF